MLANSCNVITLRSNDAQASHVSEPGGIEVDKFGHIVPADSRRGASDLHEPASEVPALDVVRLEITPADPASRRDVLSLAVAISVGLHLTVVATALLWMEPLSGIGGTDQPLETISVELVILPAVPQAAASASATSAAAVTKVHDPPGQSDVSSSEDERRKTKTEPSPDQDKPQSQEPTRPKTLTVEAKPPSSETATISVAAPDVMAKPAQVSSASPGELRRFAREVARALARTPPGSHRRAGTVIVTFAVAADGMLESISVERSSGDKRLDAAALAAARRARFPKPPRNANSGQRTFVMPYHFRHGR